MLSAGWQQRRSESQATAPRPKKPSAESITLGPSVCLDGRFADAVVLAQLLCLWRAHERKDECERSDGRDQGLADVNPSRDKVGDGCYVGSDGEKNHVRLQVFSRHAAGDSSAAEPWLLTTLGANPWFWSYLRVLHREGSHASQEGVWVGVAFSGVWSAQTPRQLHNRTGCGYIERAVAPVSGSAQTSRHRTWNFLRHFYRSACRRFLCATTRSSWTLEFTASTSS